MAHKNKQLIYNPSFNDIALHSLRSITPQQKESLTNDELKIFKSDYTLQKFCAEERMDEVMYLMAKVGISWTFRVEREGGAAEDIEANTADQYLYPLKRLDLTEAMRREGVCLTSSRDVMNMSHLAAQNCGTGVYGLSKFAKDVADKINEIKQLNAWDREVAMAQEAQDALNNLLLEQLNSFEYIEEVMGVDVNDLRVLSALYKKRLSALRLRDFPELTKAKGKKMYLKPSMDKLIKLDYITFDKKSKNIRWMHEAFFMITGKGIDVVMRYRKLIFKNAFGV